jgi:uridylate kinase
MGMLATIINACALQETLEKSGQPTRVLSAIDVAAMCEPFIRRRAIRHLELGRVAILAAGTGNPFFTTDTCAALRAAELDVDLLIKATKVDGVYSDDPEKNPDAKLFEKISYDDLINKNLRILDHSAVSLSRDNNIPIIVLNIFKKGNMAKAICGEQVGTLIRSS